MCQESGWHGPSGSKCAKVTSEHRNKDLEHHDPFSLLGSDSHFTCNYRLGAEIIYDKPGRKKKKSKGERGGEKEKEEKQTSWNCSSYWQLIIVKLFTDTCRSGYEEHIYDRGKPAKFELGTLKS